MKLQLNHFAFEPEEGLESKLYSPTYPESEDAIRGQIQGISNQLRDRLNQLMEELSAETDGASGADYIGSAPINGLTSRRVGGQLRELFTQMQNLVIGAIPDGSITTEKLADGAVTEEKMALPAEQIATGTYTGTGTSISESAPMVIEVGFRPKLFMNAIKSTSSSEWAYAKNLMIWFGAVKTGDRYVTASDTGVSWYGSYPMNDSGTQYFWIAMGG